MSHQEDGPFHGGCPIYTIYIGDLLYVFPCVILFLCFSVLLVLRLPRLGKRELILVLFVRLFGLCLFRFVGFLFLLGKGCGLWLWHSLDISLTFFAANASNPAFEVTFPPQFQEYYERKPYAIKSFGLRVAPLLESANINTKKIQKHFFSDIPSWCITKPTILFDLHNSKNSLSDSHVIKQNFQELQSRLSDYQHIYTDGSKVEDKVGCAYISGSHHEKIRLHDGSSIFTAEQGYWYGFGLRYE